MEQQEYTILQLSKLACVSTRTLRYYDEIGLLHPRRVSQANYRIYGQEQVDLLQQILFYRELGMELKDICHLIHSPNFDRLSALRTHLEKLQERQEYLSNMVHTVQQTIAALEGEYNMTDAEKFECFKKEQVRQNEEKYGKEIREKYGDSAIDQSNAKRLSLTQEQYRSMELLGQQILDLLKEAVENGLDPAGDEGQKIAQLHKEWLSYSWGQYSKEAHAGLAQMYVADPRFTAYYDKACSGCAQFLCDAITAYTR